MNADWRPDDSFLERGYERVKKALADHKVSYDDRIVTSVDEGVAEVQESLKRPDTPGNIRQWQVPIAFGDEGEILCFRSEMDPGARVAEHAHSHVVYRIVLKGSLIFNGKVLKAGDWMVVPAGMRYALQAGEDGCSTQYHHGKCPPFCWPF